jgi:hypothetical protein
MPEIRVAAHALAAQLNARHSLQSGLATAS